MRSMGKVRGNDVRKLSRIGKPKARARHASNSRDFADQQDRGADRQAAVRDIRDRLDDQFRPTVHEIEAEAERRRELEDLCSFDPWLYDDD